MEQYFKKYEYSFIYALIDPNDNIIKYIGKSVNPKRRFANHLCEKKDAPKNIWIRGLIANKQQPILKILCKCKIENVNKLEKKYITIYKKTLYNEREGGNGWGLKNKRRWSEKCLNGAKARMRKIKIKDIKTSEILEFESIISVAKFLNSTPSKIIAAAKKQKHHKSVKGYYIWYADEEFKEPTIRPNLKRNIKRIDPKSGEIKLYENMNMVVADGFGYSTVIKILRKEKHRKTHKGYKWEID